MLSGYFFFWLIFFHNWFMIFSSNLFITKLSVLLIYKFVTCVSLCILWSTCTIIHRSAQTVMLWQFVSSASLWCNTSYKTMQRNFKLSCCDNSCLQPVCDATQDHSHAVKQRFFVLFFFFRDCLCLWAKWSVTSDAKPEVLLHLSLR